MPHHDSTTTHLIEQCVWKYHEHTSNRCDIGWPYRVVYRYGFSEAVSNTTITTTTTTTSDDHPDLTITITTPDVWNGWTPLHYAVKCRHATALAGLLEILPVDTPDAQHHTALYLAAVVEEYEELAEMLRKHGAAAVSRSSNRGELLGRVAATQATVDQQREERQRQADAAAAATQQQQLHNNMRLLHERGEQIQQLGDTTRQVHEGAADYATMAQQLKASVQQRNARWGLF